MMINDTTSPYVPPPGITTSPYQYFQTRPPCYEYKFPCKTCGYKDTCKNAVIT